MSQQLVRVPARLPMPQSASASGITPQQWRVLTDAIFPNAKSPEAVSLALDYCRARKLDPFKRTVHIVPTWNSSLNKEVETIWAGINELQVTAARSGAWAGMDEPRWGPDITRKFTGQLRKKQNNRDVYENVEYTVTFPEWCAVTVYRMVGRQRCAFTEPVYWLEAYARMNRWCDVPNEMWRKRPRGQLHKNAKAAAIRAAFPEDADYTAEEMAGQEIEAGGFVIEGQAESLHPELEGDGLGHIMDAPAPPPPPQPKRQTVGQWIDHLENTLKAQSTREGVDATITSSEVQNALQRLENGPLARLQEVIRAALERTAQAPEPATAEPADDFPGEWTPAPQTEAQAS